MPLAGVDWKKGTEWSKWQWGCSSAWVKLGSIEVQNMDINYQNGEKNSMNE